MIVLASVLQIDRRRDNHVIAIIEGRPLRWSQLMTHQLMLELGDELYQPLARAARQAGLSLEAWATAQLRSCAASSAHQSADLARLMTHAGAVDLGRPTGTDNASIDADLAREYSSSHQDIP
jgi:hypothetical protein